MTYLIFVLAAIALLAGFIVLTWYEGRRSSRVLHHHRSRLDSVVSRALFITKHVDLAAYLRDEARRLAENGGHIALHLTLRAVRSVERLLTRLVRHLRSRAETDREPRETMRDFVKTLSHLKGQLETTRPVREAQLSKISRLG
jgi:hypothetical protein